MNTAAGGGGDSAPGGSGGGNWDLANGFLNALSFVGGVLNMGFGTLAVGGGVVGSGGVATHSSGDGCPQCGNNTMGWRWSHWAFGCSADSKSADLDGSIKQLRQDRLEGLRKVGQCLETGAEVAASLNAPTVVLETLTGERMTSTTGEKVPAGERIGNVVLAGLGGVGAAGKNAEKAVKAAKTAKKADKAADVAKCAKTSDKAKKVIDVNYKGKLPPGEKFPAEAMKELAKKNGWRKISGHHPHGATVYYDSINEVYITRDVDGHSGGSLKIAKKIEDLFREGKRMGTYTPDLIRIGK